MSLDGHLIRIPTRMRLPESLARRRATHSSSASPEAVHVHPCLRGDRQPLQNASRHPSVPRVQAPRCSFKIPLAWVHSKLPHPLRQRAPQTFAPTRSSVFSPASPPCPEGLPKEPSASDAEGTSCRRVQSTFFSFQRRATTSRAATGDRPSRNPNTSR